MQIDHQRWKIYFDTCCLSRFFDDQAQDRIRSETESIREILGYFQRGYWDWIASEVLTNEVNKNPDLSQRDEIKELIRLAHQNVLIGTLERSRSKQLEMLGFQTYDALHLACAESGGADILLTTDDPMLNRTKRISSKLRVQVENPHTWLQEETEMNKNQIRERDIEECQHREAKFREVLDKLSQYKDGKGDYSVDRHKRPMPSIDTIIAEIEQARKIEQEE